EHFRSNKKIAQLARQVFDLFHGAIGNDQALALLLGTLQGNRPPCAPGAEHHHPQIAKVDDKFFANRATEALAVRVEAPELSIIDLDRVYRSDATRGFIQRVSEFSCSDLVGQGKINAHESQFANQFHCLTQFVSRYLKSHVSHIDLGVL